MIGTQPVPQSDTPTITTRGRAQEAEVRDRIQRARTESLHADFTTLLGIEIDRVKAQLVDAQTNDEVRDLQGQAKALRRILKYLT